MKRGRDPSAEVKISGVHIVLDASLQSDEYCFGSQIDGYLHRLRALQKTEGHITTWHPGAHPCDDERIYVGKRVWDTIVKELERACPLPKEKE